MKIQYVGTQTYQTVINHSRNITLNETEDTEAIVVEDARNDPGGDLPAINTCPAVRLLSRDKELGQKFQSLYGIHDSPAVSYLYGFVGKSATSDFIEMSYSTRLMCGDVGPHAGFVKGSAVVSEGHFDAVPSLSNLVEGLQEMGYTGELTVGIDTEYKICNVILGMFVGGWVLFNELAKGNMYDYYHFCHTGVRPKGLHRNGIAVANMMSLAPYPATGGDSFMQIPPDAEKHIYRNKMGATDIAYAATWGSDIAEAKRRCRITLDNCTSLNPELQYRIDYGYKERFVLMTDTWHKFGGVSPR